MVTFYPGREQARLQGDISVRFTEHWALTGPHLWMEIASTPTSRTPGIKEWLQLGGTSLSAAWLPHCTNEETEAQGGEAA